MTPALFRQLLDIYTLPDPEVDWETGKKLIDMGMIRQGSHGLQVTERGHKMMKMLQEVPLPIQEWVAPRGEECVRITGPNARDATSRTGPKLRELDRIAREAYGKVTAEEFGQTSRPRLSPSAKR